MSQCKETITWEFEDGTEEDVVVDFYVEPAQNGGWYDPSWDAYIECVDDILLNGESIIDRFSDDDIETIKCRLEEDL